MIQEFIGGLNKEINERIGSGFFKKEYFTTVNYNPTFEVHSRIIPIIVNVCYKLNYEVEVERGFNYYDKHGKKVSFKPDISIYQENKLIGIVEYESTNSSDARFYNPKRGTSDLRYLQGYASNEENNIPEFWIIITTLPKKPVDQKDWKSREFPKKSTKFQKLIKSPFNYYFPKYVEKTKKILSANKIRTDVFLLNIDSSMVKLEFSKTR